MWLTEFGWDSVPNPAPNGYEYAELITPQQQAAVSGPRLPEGQERLPVDGRDVRVEPQLLHARPARPPTRKWAGRCSMPTGLRALPSRR